MINEQRASFRNCQQVKKLISEYKTLDTINVEKKESKLSYLLKSSEAQITNPLRLGTKFRCLEGDFEQVQDWSKASF